MQYEIEFINLERELAGGQYKASVVYTFAISSGSDKTRGRVVLTDGGAEIIELRGKDPKTAARIALERLLRTLREPFKTQIVLRIPHGHAEYFSKYGNYGSLPVLED